MTWTARLSYTAGGLTSDHIAALTDALGEGGGIVYGSDTGRLRITPRARRRHCRTPPTPCCARRPRPPACSSPPGCRC